jgi:hypothetical protein
MKKLLIAAFALCLGVTAMAGSAAGDDYNAMDLGIWFGVPTSMKTANVRGFRLGFPISAGDGYVSGLELALFCAATDEIEGLQLSCVAIADKVTGAQISIVNICDNEVKGTQLGVVNSAGRRGWQFGLVNSSNNAKFQFGLINLNEGGLWPFSFLVNFGRDSFKSTETICAEASACKKCASKAKKCPKCK